MHYNFSGIISGIIIIFSIMSAVMLGIGWVIGGWTHGRADADKLILTQANEAIHQCQLEARGKDVCEAVITARVKEKLE